MPISYRIDDNKRLIFVVASGKLTMNDLYNYQMETWASEQVREYDELVDLTAVDSILPATSEHIREFSDFATSMETGSIHSRLAIVAKGDFEFGLARMFQVFRESHPQSRKEVAVFRSVPDAMKFLRNDAD